MSDDWELWRRETVENRILICDKSIHILRIMDTWWKRTKLTIGYLIIVYQYQKFKNCVRIEKKNPLGLKVLWKIANFCLLMDLISEMIVSWLRNEMDIPAVFTLVAMVAIFLVLCYIAVMVTYGVWILRQVYVIDKWVDLWYNRNEFYNCRCWALSLLFRSYCPWLLFLSIFYLLLKVSVGFFLKRIRKVFG